MTDVRVNEIVARYGARARRERVSGGGWVCALFTALLGAAFWAGAVFASTPWGH